MDGTNKVDSFPSREFISWERWIASIPTPARFFVIVQNYPVHAPLLLTHLTWKKYSTDVYTVILNLFPVFFCATVENYLLFSPFNFNLVS